MKKKITFKFTAVNERKDHIILFINEYQKARIERKIERAPLHIIFQGKFYLTESIKILPSKPLKVDYSTVPDHLKEKIKNKTQAYKERLDRFPSQIVIDKWVSELNVHKV